MAESFDHQLQRLDNWIGREENFAILYVDYNKLLSDPAGTVLEIDRFLGLQLKTDAMIKAVDPTLHRQRSDRLPK
jgi:Sulfotransferase domain